MKNISSLFLCCAFCAHLSNSFSQSHTSKWIFNPYDEKVFIENKGQFALAESELDCKILYSFEQGNTTFFLCKDQFIVREAKDETVTAKVDEEEAEKDDPATEYFPSPTFSYLKFSFDKMNSSCTIRGEMKSGSLQKYYLPSTEESITATAFSQVVYKNMYDGIDLIFSAHEKNGLKYQYIIHPFADASLIHLNYFGDGKISLDKEGNIHAGNRESEVVDHVPKTFYQDNDSIIPSTFSFDANSYSIRTSNYDHSRTIVIDPWVTNPNFQNQNKAFDIAADADGNVYVFGGYFNWAVKKFTADGNPIWTFSTPYNQWYGAFAVDPSGRSIVTEGCCGGGIIRLDSSGNSLWSVAHGTDEYWRLAYNCDFSQLYLATGYASSAGLLFESISLLDTATGAISNSTALFASSSEPRSLAVGLDGNLYILSCTSANVVMAITPSFTTIFSATDGYNLLYNGPLYANGANTTSGQNGISAGNNFVCTSDGATLYKRSLTNGGTISSITIPGGSIENNSGVLVDSCDNIYVGSSNAVIKYDSSLNLISSTATTGAVYCLSPGKDGELLACGNGFIASIDLSVCRDIFCNGTNNNLGSANFSVSDTQICEKFCIDFFDQSSNNPTSWQWNFPGGSPSSSTDQNPANICYNIPGVYDVTLTATGPNGSVTLTLSNYITVYAAPPFPTINQVGYTLTSSAAYSYQWQLNSADIPGATNQSYTVLQSGTYTVVVTDSNGCVNSSSVKVLISGIDDVVNGDKVYVFPNPAADEIAIQVSSIQTNEATTVSIINVLGEIIHQQKVKWKDRLTLDVKNFPPGIYLLKVETEKEKFAARFVKG